MTALSSLNIPRTAKSIPSLIKWTGSKRSQASNIASLIPPYKRYIEPFLGGAALLYLTGVPGSIGSDIYRPLINLWKLIQKDPNLVIQDYSRKWSLLNDELDSIDVSVLKPGHGLPLLYYQVRDRFNITEDPLDLNFIMRTCVNGIVRFNAAGEFNNSFHLSRRGMKPDRFARNVRLWTRVIQGVEFICQDYQETIKSASKGDFVYFDPPYANTNQRYSDHIDLSEFFNNLDKLNWRGVNWALSFDGKRGTSDLTFNVPQEIYKRRYSLKSGLSPVNKVLNGPIEMVEESLYLNY